MENENKELQENLEVTEVEEVQEEVQEEEIKEEVTKKCKYAVHIKFEKEILKTFAKFSNNVRHPRVTGYMLLIGAMLFALPFVNHDIKLPGQIVCYVMGPILILLSLFRHNISVAMMKDNPEIKANEDIIYKFGNTGVQVERGGKTEHMGNYKKIYRLWEDEKHFYMGMNEDDLLVLPKNKFEEGDASTFRDFILDKSRCVFTWKPTRIDNIIKWKLIQSRTKNQQEDNEKEK